VHPAAVALGLKFADPRNEFDANERCVALLEVTKTVVRDYRTPAGAVLQWDLVKKIAGVFQFLTDCRPHTISMGNAMQVLNLPLLATRRVTPRRSSCVV
jgi:translation initiation factor eIF-2B subunit delta